MDKDIEVLENYISCDKTPGYSLRSATELSREYLSKNKITKNSYVKDFLKDESELSLSKQDNSTINKIRSVHLNLNAVVQDDGSENSSSERLDTLQLIENQSNHAKKKSGSIFSCLTACNPYFCRSKVPKPKTTNNSSATSRNVSKSCLTKKTVVIEEDVVIENTKTAEKPVNQNKNLEKTVKKTTPSTPKSDNSEVLSMINELKDNFDKRIAKLECEKNILQVQVYDLQIKDTEIEGRVKNNEGNLIH